MLTQQLFLLVFTCVAVFFLGLVVISVLNKAMQRYQEKYLSKTMSDLSDMFFFVDVQQLAVLTLAMSAAGVAVGLLMFGPIITIMLGLTGLASPTILSRYYKHRRLKMFERQLVDALGGLSNAFRAGLTFRQAMEEIAKTADAPLSQEFSLAVREIRVGTALEESLENMAKRVKSDDLDLVVTSVTIARSLGGNMAEMFETIANTIRERFRIEGKIRSLTSQGKLQGIVIGLMPVFVYLGFDYVRPDLTRPMMASWFGYGVIALVVVMELLGALLIRKIISIEV
jgi:tight adherence protein B